jgi:hypothetical protein
MIRYFSVLLGIGMLVGCMSSEAIYKRNMQAWVGRTPEQLVTEWGNPTQFIMDGDKQFFIYRTEKKVDLPNQSIYNTTTNPPILLPVNQTTIYQETFFCETTFVVQNDHITDWLSEGNACRVD